MTKTGANRYVVFATTDIGFKKDGNFEIDVKMYHSLGRIEFFSKSDISDVEEYKVAKVLANTDNGKPLVKEGDICLQFGKEKLEFDSDDAAILWFKLTHE
jgi:hypothetical protein